MKKKNIKKEKITHLITVSNFTRPYIPIFSGVKCISVNGTLYNTRNQSKNTFSNISLYNAL